MAIYYATDYQSLKFVVAFIPIYISTATLYFDNNCIALISSTDQYPASSSLCNPILQYMKNIHKCIKF